MPRDANGWLSARFPSGNQAAVVREQAFYQTEMDIRLNAVADATTRRFLKKFNARVGKLLWQASGVGIGRPTTISQWKKTGRESADEEMLVMNCWEGVLYIGYQADAMTKAKILNWENLPGTEDAKLRGLFGAATPFASQQAQPGDILTFANVGKGGAIDHVAVYAGMILQVPMLLHNLAWNAQITGIQGGGCIHFATVQDTVDNYKYSYNTTATVYMTRPFWQSKSPTFEYFATL